MKAIYKLHYSCGRQGKLTGLFVEEEEIVDWLVKSGLELYFGEVLGKHSEVCGPLEKCDFSFISKDENVIDVILNNDLCNGYNPFDTLLLGTEDLLGDKYEDNLTANEVYHLLFDKN